MNSTIGWGFMEALYQSATATQGLSGDARYTPG
jgi:hypothetical protein